MTAGSRAELFRLLGDEDRLRLLALCAVEELTVGELATLLDESQPQVTKKSQPLRESGLLAARRDGTRTLLRTQTDAPDPVVEVALEEGRTICTRDGSLARVAAVVSAREEASRRFFDDAGADPTPASDSSAAGTAADALGYLPMLATLLPSRELAIDVGTGEGALLPLLSALYTRVVAIDRSASRLARCSARIASWGLPNVRLREGDIEDPTLARDLLGAQPPGGEAGADLVAMARVLHHAARPQDSIAAAVRLLRPGGHLIVVDFFPHDDETMRDQGDVWLGFEPAKLRGWFEATSLEHVSTGPMPGRFPIPLQIVVGRRPAANQRKR